MSDGEQADRPTSSDSADDQELGITKRKQYETGEWYAEVVQKAKIADYAPMGGFIIVRPRGWSLWESIQETLNRWFKRSGVSNTYFPMFIPESFLEREKDVVEGFDPEVAWVTHGGHNELEERLAVRPTSESIIAPYMAKWVRSHRDLPLRLNQWCSVVRWEATETKPFFRTKEFCWQEGHTAHKDRDGAWKEAMLRLDQYERLYRELLAIPVLKGRKPEHDKFPGADTTTTVEALMPDGRSVQGATSHYLGTSFAEAFDIRYVDEKEREQLAHTTSWGISWRSLGALIMTHSDDQGLVLPPTIAPQQVVIVPIWQEDTRRSVLEYAEEITNELVDAGIRVELDDREERNPGFKFNEWELYGVPLRLELGPNEQKANTVTLVHRHDGDRFEENRSDIVTTVEDHLDTIQDQLYDQAEENLHTNVRTASNRAEILGTIGKHGGYVKAPWCGNEQCESPIKDAIAADIVMVPLDRNESPIGDSCAICSEPAEETAYFAKSY